jgi:hypothetical protein
MIGNGLKSLIAIAGALTMFASARADDIKIGEINSYSGLPQFTEPYRKGWQLAIDEINAEGGVDGKKLVVISKDDGGKPVPVCSLPAAHLLRVGPRKRKIHVFSPQRICSAASFRRFF